MTIARNRPAGGYATSDTISAAEFEHFDKYLSEAIHGAGGTYVLVSDLVLGGQDLYLLESLHVGEGAEIGADLFIGGSTEIVSDLQVGATFHVDGIVVFDDNLDVGGDVQISSTLHVDGLVDFDDDLNVDGAGEFGGDLAVHGQATFAQDIILVGSLTAAGGAFIGAPGITSELRGTTELRGVMALAGSSAIKARVALGGDSDASYSPLACTNVYLPASVTLSADVNYVIDDTGAQNDMRIEFTTTSAVHLLKVCRPGGALLIALSAIPGAPAIGCICQRISSVWQVVHRDYVPV